MKKEVIQDVISSLTSNKIKSSSALNDCWNLHFNVCTLEGLERRRRGSNLFLKFFFPTRRGAISYLGNGQ